MTKGKIYPYNLEVKPNLGVEVKLPTIISFERYNVEEFIILDPEIKSIIKNFNNGIDQARDKLDKAISEVLKDIPDTGNKYTTTEFIMDQCTLDNISKALNEYKMKDDKK